MKTNLNVDTQALREKILDLAMRGKLVKQDAGDQPASVLLEKIKAEKVELVKEGKIKKSKKFPEITDDEKPFDIPDSWEWVRLGDIVTVAGGKRIPAGLKMTTENTGHVYIRVSDMKNGTIDTSNLMYISEDIFSLISKYIINEDDIYITVAGTIGKVGIVPKELNGANLTENADRLIFRNLNQIWLKDSLESIFIGRQIEGATTKVGQPKLAIRRIQNLILPLPPLAEQKRIADKVSELFKQVDVIEKNVAEYQDLEQAMRSKLLDLAMRGKLVDQDPSDEPGSELLKKIQAEKAELVKEGKIKRSKKLPEITDDEKPFDIPDSWEWVRLGDITIITSGGTPSKSKKEYWESGDIPWITPALMGKAKHKTYKGETGYINKNGLSNSSAKLIPKNSIVYSSRAPIGHINVVPFDYTTNQGCKSVTPINENIDFLYYTLMQQTPNIISRASGTTFKEISGSKFAETPIPLPPLAEQKRIADKLTRFFEDLDTIKQNLATVS